MVKGAAGLVRVLLPEPEKQVLHDKIVHLYPQAVFDPSSFREEINEFKKYFSAQESCFSFGLDFSGSTFFQKMVWSAAEQIPFGALRTYGWVAQMIGRPKAARAAGNALGKNPFPIIIPCHRVIKENGTLGGFSAPLGTVMKTKLLRLEGVKF